MPTKPDGDRYAFGRGRSVDRWYIEAFLQEHQSLMRGRCLEIGDDRYTRQVGGADIRDVDILDIDATNERATIIGDLQELSSVEDGSYDCIIVVQVLQYLQDPSAGVRELRRILAPGGSVLVTVPTMAPADIRDRDLWRFMPQGVEHLFSPHFEAAALEVRSYGNLLTGLAYWAGLAQEDLPRKAWRLTDPIYPVIISARATVPLR